MYLKLCLCELQLERRSDLENELHFQATVPLIMLTVVHLIISFGHSSVTLDFLRCYGLFLMGTWVCHTAFILYIPGVPGEYVISKGLFEIL